MSEETRKMFISTDFYVSAYFKAKGQPLVKVEKIPKTSRVVFCFDEAGQGEEVKKFYMGQLEVNALAYANAVKELKSLTK